MKTPLLLFFAAFHLTALSQKSIILKGRVLDKSYGSELPYATVALWTDQDQLVTGTTTGDHGEFELLASPSNSLYIKVRYLGYAPLDTLLKFHQISENPFLVLAIAPQSSALTEVTVQAERTATSQQLDKQSFRAAALGNIVSGTGLDVLQRLPSVTINAEGKILMRGNAEFLVTVNGTFTNQSASDVLAALPANSIESIEVISSPSANHDAEGKAGIINFVTKKDLAQGWSLAANINLGNLDPDRYGGDLSGYHSSARFHSFVTAHLRQYNIGGYRQSELRTSFQDTISYLPAGGDRPTEEKVYGIRAGSRYQPDKSTSIGAGMYYGYRQSDRTANLHYQQYSNGGSSPGLYQVFDTSQLESLYYNENLFVRTGEFFTSNADFSKTFAGKNKLSWTGIYEYSILGGPLTNQNTDEITGTLTIKERSDETSPLHAWRLQGDYSIYLQESLSMEAGYQWRSVRHDGNFHFERLNLATQLWENDPEFSDKLELRQSVHAGYLLLKGQYRQWQYRAGLRGEQMYRRLVHANGTEPVELNSFDLFPSVQILWKASNEQELKAAYSKRIDRPTTKALSPFKNHRHSEAIWIGDPALQPEISHNVELAYVKKFEKGRISLTAYQNRTARLIFRTNQSYSRITLITLQTNAGNSRSTGLEIISEWQPLKWLRILASGNGYAFRISDIQNAEINEANSINYKLNGNLAFHWHPKFSLKWDAGYVSETVTAQGMDSDLFLSNIGLKYLPAKNLTLELLFQNIFDTNIQTITNKNDSFYSSIEYSKYDRIIMLNLNYRFSYRSNESDKQDKLLKTEYGERDF